MMTTIGATIAEALARHAIVTGLCVALASAVLLWDSGRKAKWVDKGKQELVRASEQQGAANAAKSDQAHDAARRPGAVERLRKDRHTCPDCR